MSKNVWTPLHDTPNTWFSAGIKQVFVNWTESLKLSQLQYEQGYLRQMTFFFYFFSQTQIFKFRRKLRHSIKENISIFTYLLNKR